MHKLIYRLTEIRATRPEAVAEALASRKRRSLLNASGTLLLIAADHTARGLVGTSGDPGAMADRGDLLERLVLALGRPGVDGILATSDLIEELALLGALDHKVVFGSMNRGGLAGSTFELDDRFTAVTAEVIGKSLDGGKMMIRIADDDPGTLLTMVSCAACIDRLAEQKIPTLIEVFASHRVSDTTLQNVLTAEAMARAIGIVSALGSTSAYLWLKLPIFEGFEKAITATTLPTLLLGGDPGADASRLFQRWASAMKIPQVRGLVAGRALLYPSDGNVARAVDTAAEIVAGKSPDVSTQ